MPLRLTVLGADENFPDSCFVEDVAVVTDEIAIITNPGAASRNGEVKSIIPVLEKFRPLKFIRPPGTLEGGDVMQADNHFYIMLNQVQLFSMLFEVCYSLTNSSDGFSLLIRNGYVEFFFEFHN